MVISGRRIADVIAVSALAAIVTLVIAAPVLRAPSERVFGMESVGRHHDPFTVMERFARPVSAGAYVQPVTDLPGAWLARLTGAVAAYNWLVLLSFPLSAAAAYLLARYLALSRTGATVAAMAYAFSPFHLAHAAYHPHIAQTQWVPLYFLALWRCLDAVSPMTVALLCGATMAVTLSNFYGGLIAGVITPVALVAYWLVTRRAHPGGSRRLGVTVGSLALIAAGGLAYVSYAAGAVVANPQTFAAARSDLFRYSATGWSYLVPPVAHPLLGAGARRFWDDAGVGEGLLEQQLFLGWAVVALGLIAVARWLLRDRAQASLATVPVLVLVAVTAVVCSLPPERMIAGVMFVLPSGLLYDVAPMFRSYARFGVVVQLMAALLAGAGVEYLRRAGTRPAQMLGVALVALVVAEYAVQPSGLWRDTLPTAAHRWVTRQPGRGRAFDCLPRNQESASIEWLTNHRVTVGSAASDCTEPLLLDKLAGLGYSHLLVRRDTADGRWFAAHHRTGLPIVAHYPGAHVFAITTPKPGVYTADTLGFYAREHDADRSWQWMGPDAEWTVVNTGSSPIVAGLAIELAAFYRSRRMEIRLDGHPIQTLDVDSPRRMYQLDPLALGPGSHQLLFHPIEQPTVASNVLDNGDLRPLSFSVGRWTWTVRNEPH